MFKRSLVLPIQPKHSLFLWGPRQVGKSSLLRKTYPHAYWIDLLKSEESRRYGTNPELLRQELIAKPQKLVIIDEVQKVPALLDEVHWLIENTNTKFVLCGSSARKLRRGHANLLGGRALRYELFGLTAQELAKDFNLSQLLNSGYLPRHYLSDEPHRLIASYVADYLKEEIAAEGLVRNLPSFSNFLDAAALSDTELTNFSTIARDCGVSSPSIKEYFQILEDTLLARRLPAYQKRPKRRVITSPKFYFSDLGVVNYLAKRKKVEIGSEVFGKAFENWLHHELQSFSVYSEQFYSLSYWRLASGVEVDFIVNDMEFAIEAKATKKVTSDHLRGLRSLTEDYPKAKRLLVCMESKARKTEDDILILPVSDFLEGLYAGLKWF
jgi:uncharacterized protein